MFVIQWLRPPDDTCLVCCCEFLSVFFFCLAMFICDRSHLICFCCIHPISALLYSFSCAFRCLLTYFREGELERKKVEVLEARKEVEVRHVCDRIISHIGAKPPNAWRSFCVGVLICFFVAQLHHPNLATATRSKPILMVWINIPSMIVGFKAVEANSFSSSSHRKPGDSVVVTHDGIERVYRTNAFWYNVQRF